MDYFDARGRKGIHEQLPWPQNPQVFDSFGAHARGF